ncbi:hypothetical protein QE152_g23724 [Popillia japonica]|uniref:THAP-type domain-containing protein n=1 Tax=Popillia japonica TaxID=7064 RepID=A0AAW1KDR1_POPJA
MIGTKSKRACIVENCNSEYLQRYTFPIYNDNIKKIWMDRIANNSIRFHEVPTIENSFYRNVDSQKIEQPLEKNSIAQSTVIESDTFTKITATYSTNMENQPSTSTGFITDKRMKAIPSTLTNRATTKMHLPEEVTEMYKFAGNYRRHLISLFLQ